MRGRLLLLALLLGTGAVGLIAAGTIQVPSLPWKARDPAPNAPRSNDGPGVPSTAQKAIEEAQAALGLDGRKADGKDKSDDAPLAEPVLDVARISPDGLSVFAGRAAPNSYVTIFADGEPAGTTRADSQGAWSLATEHKFASLDPKLSFRADPNPPAPAAPRASASSELRQEPPVREAARAPQTALASPTAEVMKKFEDIVAKAREKHAKAEATPQKAEGKAPHAEGAAPEQAKPDDTPPQATRAGAPSLRFEDERAASAEPQAPRQATEQAAEEETERADRAGVTAGTRLKGGAAEQQRSIPVPIMFVYNEAEFTPEGRRAVGLLLEYLKLERLSSIQLSGHADERGTDEYNMELSRERLDAVARYLREGGYTGELELTPKGKREPYRGVDRSKYTREALYQLDRRVELHLTR